MTEQVVSVLKSAPRLQPDAPAAIARRVHVVKAGETPSGIAAEYDVSTAALEAVNNLSDAGFTSIGQELSIP
jgi:LysM repeat protein